MRRETREEWAKKVFNAIKAAGIHPLGIRLSDEPEIEDDSIQVTEKIDVQLASYGDGYMSVNKWTDDETMISYPERLEVGQVISDLKKALT